MDINDIRKLHNVKVNNGSGVILKPLSEDKLYILTAYHVIKDTLKENIKCSFDSESLLANQKIEVLEVIKDKEDTAIIIIARNFQSEAFIPFCSKPPVNEKLLHFGYPINRNNSEVVSTSNVLHIHHSNDGCVKNGLIEYEYEKAPTKNEIEGMSGGGIFTEDFRLVGIHKQSSNLDQYELLGKAAYIPIARYRTVICENELAHVVEFDLNNFASFLSIVFDFTDQQAIAKCVNALLTNFREYKYELYEISPIQLLTRLKGLGRITSDTNIDEFGRQHWIHFTEFLIGVMILLDIHSDNDDFIICIYDKFHYVYSRKCFDLFDARKELDLSLIKGMHGQSKLVVGGLNSNHYDFDVLPTQAKVPSISHGLIVQDMDIALSDRQILNNMTIINASLFKDTIHERGKDIGKSDNQLLKYKELLNDVINGE